MLKKTLTSLALGLTLISGAQAQNQEAVERYGPFFYLPSEPSFLVYTTGVGANDLLHLKKALREHPGISTLILKDNPGGLVHIGLVVAEEVYERGLNTFIPKDSVCASACSFVFFAGKQRIANGRLGVHQISAPELSGEQAQYGVSDIVSTLPKYGVSADVLGIMFSTPPKEMYFFSPQEIVKYGINRGGGTQVAAADTRPPATQQQPLPKPGGAQSQPAAPDAPSGQQQLPPRQPQQQSEPQQQPAPVDNPYTKKGAPAVSDEQRSINAAALMIQAGSASNEEAMNFTREFYAERVDYFKKERSNELTPRSWTVRS